MITCNGGYCSFKFQSGSTMGCKYVGYCDYQCPKDSRFTYTSQTGGYCNKHGVFTGVICQECVTAQKEGV
jgi:hypothetical protein